MSLLGVGLSCLAATAAWRHEDAAAQDHLARIRDQRLSALQEGLRRSELTTELLTAFHRASDEVTAVELAQFCAPLLANDAGVRWVARHQPAAETPILVVPANHHDEAARILRLAAGSRAAAPTSALTPTGRVLLLARRPAASAANDSHEGELVVAVDLLEQFTEALRTDGEPWVALGVCEPGTGRPLASRTADGSPAPWLAQQAVTRTTAGFGEQQLELIAAVSPHAPLAGHPLALGLLTGGLLATASLTWVFGRAARVRAHIEALVVERTRQLAAANDELERRVAERTRELADANREMEAFNYSVSHDLRAPLRAIDGFAGMLDEDHGTALPDDGRRVLGVIRSACADMSRLIDALLRLSRTGRQAVVRSTVDVDAMAREVVQELRTHGGAATTEFTIGSLGHVDADPVLLREVLRNLLGNAVKFSRRAGRPRVALARDDAGGRATFTVQDNGVGFDPAYADKLFTPFQRLHRADEFEGTGIGLALCQRIVTRHGGSIDATAVPGAGATVRFHLPVATHAPTAAA